MIKIFFDKFTVFLKESYKQIIFLLIFTFALYYQFPCYIDSTGGAINVSDRIEVVDKYESSGSFNMAYVNELPGNLLFIIMAQFNPNWDVVMYKDVLLDNETKEDDFNRSRIMLNESTNNAIYQAFTMANKEVNVITEKLTVTFVMPEAKTGIKTGDELVSIEDVIITAMDDVRNIVKEHNAGDNLNVVVKRNDKEEQVSATIYEEDGELYIGIVASFVIELETNPKVNLNFKESETGPSGGLMTALAIYDSLTEYDLTNGLKIIGTGTMERDGSVGSIGGVKYKLAGAVKKKADIFLVPAGENYKEVIKIAKERNYKIKIVPIETFSEAVDYLMTLK